MQYAMFKQKPWKMWVRNVIILIVLIGAVKGTKKVSSNESAKPHDEKSSPNDDASKLLIDVTNDEDTLKQFEGQLLYSLRKLEQKKERKFYHYFGVHDPKEMHQEVASSNYTLDVAYYSEKKLLILRDVLSTDQEDAYEYYEKYAIPGVKVYNEGEFTLERKHGQKNDENDLLITITGNTDDSAQKFEALPDFQFPTEFKEKMIPRNRFHCDACEQTIEEGEMAKSVNYLCGWNSVDYCKNCQKAAETEIELKFKTKYLSKVQFQRGMIFWALDPKKKEYELQKKWKDEERFENGKYVIYIIVYQKTDEVNNDSNDENGDIAVINPVIHEIDNEVGHEDEANASPRKYGRIIVYCFVVIILLASGVLYFCANAQEDGEATNKQTNKAAHNIKPTDCVIVVKKVNNV